MMSHYINCGVLCCLVALQLVLGLKQFRNDYSYFGDVDGWYKMHRIPANWTDARLRCHLEGAVLASPLTRAQQLAIASLMQRYGITGAVHTGINSIFSKGDYFSVEGVPLSEIPQQWAPNEPNNLNNSEECILQQSDGSLADVACGVTLPYLCFRANTKGMVVNACGTVDPEYEFEARTGKCYKFHRTPRTWTRAFMACAAEGGHLAILNGEVEAEVLRDIYARNPDSKIISPSRKDLAWVGFHDWGEHMEWRTIHGETIEQAGYSKFAPGEPNNVELGEYCGSIERKALYNDLGCHYTVPSICEKSPDTKVIAV